MNQNRAAKAVVAAGGTMATVGGAMLTNPATLVPGAIVGGAGLLLGIMGALFHDKPKRRTANRDGSAVDDEDPDQ